MPKKQPYRKINLKKPTPVTEYDYQFEFIRSKYVPDV